MTGYQGRGGTARSPFVIPRAGKIIAFTIRLGSPDATQERFFEDLYGGPPAGAAVDPAPGREARDQNNHRLLAQSPAFRLDAYFGTAPTFVLDKPLRVRAQEHRRDHRAHLGAGLRRRPRSATTGGAPPAAAKRCENVRQSAQQTKLNSVKVFGCTYFTARLYYTATYVPDNRATRQVDADD